MAGLDFDTILGGDIAGEYKRAQESSRAARDEAMTLSRGALDEYRAAMNRKSGVDIPLLMASGAMGRPTKTGSFGESMSGAMEAYGNAMQQQEGRNLSKAEKLAGIAQAQAALLNQNADFGMRQITDRFGMAQNMAQIDQLRSAARMNDNYNRMFGPGANSGGPAPTLGGVAAGTGGIAATAERAASTGDVTGSGAMPGAAPLGLPPSSFPASTPAVTAPAADGAAEKLPPDIFARYRQNQQVMEKARPFIHDPRFKAQYDRAEADNKSLLPAGVIVRSDGTLDTMGLRLAAQAKKNEQPLSSSDRKAIIEADESVSNNEAAIESIAQAKELSKKSYDNPIMSTLARFGQYVGDETSRNTMNLQNLTQSQALAQLKAIFGGAPTEGERKILLDIQGSANQPDAVRQEIYKRAEAAAKRRLDFARQQAAQMRGGTYFKPGQGPNNPAAAAGVTPPPAPTVDPLEAAMRARGLIP